MRPQRAVKEYTEEKQKGREYKKREPMKNYSLLLSPFISFCDQIELREMDRLTRRTLELYRHERTTRGDINPVHLEQELRALRDFLEWCGREDIADEAQINPSSQEPLVGLPPELGRTSSSS